MFIKTLKSPKVDFLSFLCPILGLMTSLLLALHVVCPQKLKDKTLILKVPHTLVPEHGEIRLERIKLISALLASFTGPEGAV